MQACGEHGLLFIYLETAGTSVAIPSCLSANTANMEKVIETLSGGPSAPASGADALARSVVRRSQLVYAAEQAAGIARKWTRVFPSINDLPCPADAYGPPVQLEGSSSSEESEDDMNVDWEGSSSEESKDEDNSGSGDSRHGTTLHEPGLDFEAQ